MDTIEIKDRIRRARITAQYGSATEAARSFGWRTSTYLGYENDDREPSRDMATRLAEAYRISLDWLLTGRGEMRPSAGPSSKVPVMGRVGAGAEIDAGVEQPPPEGYFNAETTVPLPVGSIAFEVVGESMYPRYGAGDIIVCPKDGTPFETIPDGAEAAVRAADGRRYLKHIFKTGTPGSYNLMSHNAAPILSVRLDWAAHVLVTIRADQWSRLSAGERNKFMAEASSKEKREKRSA